MTSDLLSFLQQSPTPFHAVANMASRLEQAGFQKLEEKEAWQLESGQRYYLTRNGSSIIAFYTGKGDPVTQGVRMVGAHTDSPCLKVKPNPEVSANGYFQLGVEVYGGVLMAPWFDRDLSLAGRVNYRGKNGQLGKALINFEKAIAIIPSVAIHLDRTQNEARNINPQKELPPILGQLGFGNDEDKDEKVDFRALLLNQLNKQHTGLNATDVLDYELCFYDTQEPGLVGLNEDFIASARLDNLLSCHMGLQALLNASGDQPALLVCNDHEEVGSASTSGAQGPMLKQTLQRWLGDAESYARAMDRSMMISADNAHGIHPNFADLHEKNHGPILNKGPVIKINANQRYASNSDTQTVFRTLCQQCDVPMQEFVTRTDLACGSTIGPITATSVGVPTLDIGVPTFAMHSIRETAGSRDAESVIKVLTAFFDYAQAPVID